MAPALPAIMAITMAAGAATSIYGLMHQPKAPVLPNPDQGKAAAAAAYAEAQALRKRQGAESTILTGPLGIQQPAQTAKATLG